MGVIFQQQDNEFVGIGENGRRWRVRQVLTGWRLEYRDPGESSATYAGTHGSLDLAMTEARASYGPAPRVPRQGTAPRDHRAVGGSVRR